MIESPAHAFDAAVRHGATRSASPQRCAMLDVGDACYAPFARAFARLMREALFDAASYAFIAFSLDAVSRRYGGLFSLPLMLSLRADARVSDEASGLLPVVADDVYIRAMRYEICCHERFVCATLDVSPPPC